MVSKSQLLRKFFLKTMTAERMLARKTIAMPSASWIVNSVPMKMKSNMNVKTTER